MRSLLKIALGIAALVVAFGAGWLVAITGTGQAIPLESLSELERGFAERMQNVVLTGHYTLKGRERRDDKPERYEITRVAKVGEHRWRFDVHMTYGSVDMTLPVVVPIRWAGDTPIVTLRTWSSQGSTVPSRRGSCFTRNGTLAAGSTASTVGSCTARSRR